MKKSLIIAALFAAVLAVSCQPKEAIIETPGDTPAAPVVRTFTCEFAQSGSKFSIADDGKTAWEANDEIFIHAGAGGDKSIVVTLSASDISADGKSATISFTEEELAPYERTDAGYSSTYYAIYPASAVTNTKSMYYNTRVNDFSQPAMGGYNDGDKMIFKNLCGIIKFKVSGDFDSFSFSGNDDETVSYAPECQWRVALKTSGSEQFELKLTSDGASCAPQTAINGSVVADGSTVNYICIPNGANLKSGFTMKFKKNGEVVKLAATNNAVNIALNKILALGDITSRLVDYVPPTVSDHTSSITGATDLSTGKGPANCYVISAPGAYKLPVVKGNDLTKSAGSVFGADILWETYNNAETVVENSVIAAIDYDGPENYVYFKTPDTLKPGNALIAAKDNEGNIIWSWHIWIPATSLNYADYGIHTSGKKMCDRNLGALNVAVASNDQKIDVTSVGLTYQWGRKDPFPGTRSIDTEGDYASHSRLSFGSIEKYTTGPITDIEATQNPTRFVYVSVDWLTPSDKTRWGDEAAKAINDPCPAGYRVPNRDKSASLWSGENITTKTGWSYNASNYWFTLGDPATVFPCAGYNDGLSYKTTFRTVLWNAHADGDPNGYNIYVYAGPKGANYSHNKSRGYFIRCVEE